ncbi:MAG: helix-turn-helix transcriptional regulator [Opitutaceae bacterium]|nr:helix-turn-helix transcriptional regulator [Opitutaceae bacterium]
MSDTTHVRMAIAERLRAAREQAGLSQGQTAKLLAMLRPTISEIEAGRRRVAADELAGFARIYGVSISWLTAEKPEVPDPAIELAARELAKLKSEDFDKMLKLLRTLRNSKAAPK